MKSALNSQFSLYNVENFNKHFPYINTYIQDKYIRLILEYLKYILENIKITNGSYSKFIIIRGFDTISHVFNNILFYTHNLDITYYHSQKAFYFYVEFIEQITEDKNMFLQLNSRDATMYVYKKTLFEINNEYRKNLQPNNVEINNIFQILNEYINLYKNLIYNIINKMDFVIYDKSTIHNIILKFENICNKLNILELKESHIKTIQVFIDKININELSIQKYIEIIEILIKKVTKNVNKIDIIKNKNIDLQLNEKINLSNEEFFTWLLK
jgi:hypothetical protein